MRELRFDLAGLAEDTDETFVHDDHEHGVVPWSAATVAWRRRDDRGEFVDLSARKNCFDALERADAAILTGHRATSPSR